MATGPPHLTARDHAHRRRVPPRVPHFLSAVRLVGRTSSQGFLPLNDITRASPVRNGRPQPLRFRSQAFSTSQRFPSNLKLHGFVSCRSRSGILPSESSPCRNRVPLSRPPCSLAVIHPRAGTPPSESFHRQFHRRPRSRVVAWLP
jgi:hypothetical protein